MFRRLDDCARILEQARHGRRAIVIGGGLLGLEAARGLFNHGIDVHVVHLAPHLMEAQLDEAGAEVLRLQLTGLGIRVTTSLSTTAIRTDGDRVTGVAFSDGSVIGCDFVVVAAGVRPAADLARRAGLAVCRGIVVDDHLACSGADDVYAIGDCAEHRGRVQGLVAPAWEQARVLAERLTGRNLHASYAGVARGDEAEGRGRRPRRDGVEGAGRGRRRGRELCGRQARRLQEADRPRRPDRWRDRHRRRGRHPQADAGLSRGSRAPAEPVRDVVPADRRRAGPARASRRPARHRADLRLQCRFEGAHRRGRARRRSRPAGDSRPHARVDRLRIVHARGAEDRSTSRAACLPYVGARTHGHGRA